MMKDDQIIIFLGNCEIKSDGGGAPHVSASRVAILVYTAAVHVLLELVGTPGSQIVPFFVRQYY